MRPKADPINEESFEMGKILQMPLEESDGLVLKDGYKERVKYFVILGQISTDRIVGVFLINSHINKKIITTKELLDCQFPLKKNDYPNTLDYDSSLDCSDLFEISKIKIINKASEIGKLTDSDRDLVIDHIERSEVITPQQKRRFGIEDKS